MVVVKDFKSRHDNLQPRLIWVQSFPLWVYMYIGQSTKVYYNVYIYIPVYIQISLTISGNCKKIFFINFVTDGGLAVYQHRERHVGGILDLYLIFM